MLLQELNVKIGLLIDEFQKNAGKVKQESDKVEGIFKTLKGALISYGVFSFLKDAVGDFMEAERAANILGMRIKSLGGDYQAATRQTMAYADAMSKVSGINDEELKVSMSGLVDVTKDVNVSMSLLQDVMDLHIATGLDMKRATELVGRSFAGERGELTELGKMFGVSQDKAVSFEAVMGAVRGQIEGTASSTNDLTQKMGSIGSKFGDLKEEIGKLASGGGFWSGIVEGLLDVTTKSLKVLNEFQDALRASWKNVGSIFKKGFKQTQDDAREIFKDFVDNTVQIFQKGEETKTKIDRVQKGKRQKWADDMAKKDLQTIQKEKMEVIKAEDAKMRVRIAKGQATNDQLLTLMKDHSEQIKTLFGEMSTQYQEYEAARLQATMDSNEAIVAMGQSVVTGLSSGFEAVFTTIAEGSATAEDAIEAFARAMGKSMLNAIASAIEGEAARGMAGYLANMLTGGPIGGAVVSAYSLPLIASLAATAGMVRGLAGMMAEGGTLTRPGLVMMAEKSSGEPETAIPLSRMDEVFQKYSHYLGKRGMAASGKQTIINVQRVNDNRGAIVASSSYDKGRAAKSLGKLLVERGIVKK